MIKTELFNVTKQAIQNGEVYPGYPSKRLNMDPNVVCSDQILEIPDGPWTASQNILPTPEETDDFKNQGYDVDTQGRPLHPWHKEMLTDTEVGVVTGKGKYYDWGPNYTVDPIVIAGKEFPRKVLLIKRGDNGAWALPGGFRDKIIGKDNLPTLEHALISGPRELKEETNIKDIGQPTAKIYEGPVADQRATIHAWPETTAYLWIIDEPLDVTADNDEAGGAIVAQWFDEDKLPDRFFGSHREMLKIALEYKEPTALKEILQSPAESLNVTEAKGGHMAYDHLFVENQDTKLFVKLHNPDNFTDPVREKHSLDYLKKEQLYIKHLRIAGFENVPERSEFIDNIMLAMDAFKVEDGWNWRVPKNKQEETRYINEILKTLDILSKQPMPDTSYQKDIDPTYPTLWDEGWNDITDEKIIAIKQKILSFKDDFDTESQDDLVKLSDNIKKLQNDSKLIKVPTEFFLAHNDARQSNITWHPEKGVKIIDWSWADAMPKNTDSTMFLIDLVKSGYDVTPYLEKYFNKDHALTLIGFWLDHSLWKTHDGTTTIRMQQVASALAAFRIIDNI